MSKSVNTDTWPGCKKHRVIHAPDAECSGCYDERVEAALRQAETRTVSATGGEKGVKPARFDLLPVDALWQVAEHYGKGAEKYTKYGECTCADATQRSTPEECVDPATRETSASGIPSTPSVNGRTPKHGASGIVSASESLTGVGETVSPEHIGLTASAELSTTPSLQNPVESAVPHQSIWTMTTRTELSGADSATAATSDAATSKAGSLSTKRRHSPGCPALEVIQSGDRNWERGYEWSKSFQALQRHAWAFWNGETFDPETGSHHMAAVVFHAFALMHFANTHPEYDDRPTSEPTHVQ